MQSIKLACIHKHFNYVCERKNVGEKNKNKTNKKLGANAPKIKKKQWEKKENIRLHKYIK